ncbi:MAG: hypothetical protein K6G08_01250 [Prevotella sp.]|nr:hypothetical protein [Prevotella sp.]
MLIPVSLFNNRYFACLLTSVVATFILMIILKPLHQQQKDNDFTKSEFYNYYETFADSTKVWNDNNGEKKYYQGIKVKESDDIIIKPDYFYFLIDGFIVVGYKDSDASLNMKDIFVIDTKGNIVKEWTDTEGGAYYYNEEIITYFSDINDTEEEFIKPDGSSVNAYQNFYLKRPYYLILVSSILGLTIGLLVFSYVLPQRYRIFRKDK